ncbi:MAG: glycoside hydrolase family 2 TIM barrel-domain containing protein [Verrucomicrobiota bacterium]|nr:glycoside hydrolase family 2 [Limisphaera sp.]MDW8381662.1 glycoside hydrolase family 2 TIM barrel-domain containing protein [Verrucomicrobiota bacterium]
MTTRWAAEVRPDRVWPEYPRPQLVRENWLNLNGLWEYAITTSGRSTPPDEWEGWILVPFPLESGLSGVGRRLRPDEQLWYRRSFRIPEAWSGLRIRLHFGAVDWACRVWVNGQWAGEHRGGYDAFSFDITEMLVNRQVHELLVAVEDPTEGGQPRGKQAHRNEGIFYTPSSGIWQTVWLEPVPDPCINRLVLRSELNGLRLRVEPSRMGEELSIRAVATAAGAEVGRVTGPVAQDLWLRIAEPRLWSPDDPFLYDLHVELLQNGQEVDRVRSYFGLRTITLRTGEDGRARIALNGRIVFQLGTLDQGYWPDGIYTPPSDDAMRADLEFLKAAGFNLARKHVKVEPERWYWWCDRLGLLVWQDMPSGENHTPETRMQFEAELQRLVEARRNHPCIVVWVLFNEGWGQYDTERLTVWIKEMDPDRLVSNASGWTDRHVGDLVDVHSYPGPVSPAPEATRAAVLGEFGGLGLAVPGHTWSTQFWGYVMLLDAPALAARYQRLLQQVWQLHRISGLSAAVYTQTTDVETECNGLLTYDRAISKLDVAWLRKINRASLAPWPGSFLSPPAFIQPVSWRYRFQDPAEGWQRPDYNDADWPEGLAGFGTHGTPGAYVQTPWSGSEIWLRRTFECQDALPREVRLLLHHDEDVAIWINGVLAFEAKGYTTDYVVLPARAEALATLRPGRNLLAVHCRQTRGGQYIDVALWIPASSNPQEAESQSSMEISP